MAALLCSPKKENRTSANNSMVNVIRNKGTNVMFGQGKSKIDRSFVSPKMTKLRDNKSPVFRAKNDPVKIIG